MRTKRETIEIKVNDPGVFLLRGYVIKQLIPLVRSGVTRHTIRNEFPDLTTLDVDFLRAICD